MASLIVNTFSFQNLGVGRTRPQEQYSVRISFRLQRETPTGAIGRERFGHTFVNSKLAIGVDLPLEVVEPSREWCRVHLAKHLLYFANAFYLFRSELLVLNGTGRDLCDLDPLDSMGFVFFWLGWLTRPASA